MLTASGSRIHRIIVVAILRVNALEGLSPWPILSTMTSSTPKEPRASLTQLRKAAGSKSLQKLQDAVRGWTSEELDTAGQDGKTPLHMAAWKGSLENVKYLVEEQHCNVDVYSRGEFSYGKTAIFFAVTQSRVDVMEYLLSRNAKVTIVNNKGQSVRSIAASHSMPPSVMNRIEQLETIQQNQWWNFRASHSDGLDYGDLDPRFLQSFYRIWNSRTSMTIPNTSNLQHVHRCHRMVRLGPRCLSDCDSPTGRHRDGAQQERQPSEQRQRRERVVKRFHHACKVL